MEYRTAPNERPREDRGVRFTPMWNAFARHLLIRASTLRGCMFPRYFMSEGMRRLGLLTFNG
jgi:hypothetical protein